MSGAPSSVTGVAMAAITPDSLVLKAISPGNALSTHIICGEGRHVHDLIVLGAELNDLHRPVEADQQRTDHGRTTKLLQHFRRDRGGVESRHHQYVGRPGQAVE